MQVLTDAGLSPAPTPTTTEIVHRPDPGLGRGVWEASPAFFWIVLAVAALATLSFFLVRPRLQKRRVEKTTTEELKR